MTRNKDKKGTEVKAKETKRKNAQRTRKRAVIESQSSAAAPGTLPATDAGPRSSDADLQSERGECPATQSATDVGPRSSDAGPQPKLDAGMDSVACFVQRFKDDDRFKKMTDEEIAAWHLRQVQRFKELPKE